VSGGRGFHGFFHNYCRRRNNFRFIDRNWRFRNWSVEKLLRGFNSVAKNRKLRRAGRNGFESREDALRLLGHALADVETNFLYRFL
jgi:hypothetical protein